MSIRLKYRFYPVPNVAHRLIHHGGRLPFTRSAPTPREPRPRFPCLYVRLWCGVPKASGKHSLQYSHSGGHQMGPLPPQAFVRLGFLSAHDAVRQWFQEEERHRPVLPNHTVQRSSAALFRIQDSPPRPPLWPGDLLRSGKSFPWAVQLYGSN